MDIRHVRHKLINLFSHSLHALLANMFMQNYRPRFRELSATEQLYGVVLTIGRIISIKLTPLPIINVKILSVSS